MNNSLRRLIRGMMREWWQKVWTNLAEGSPLWGLFSAKFTTSCPETATDDKIIYVRAGLSTNIQSRAIPLVRYIMGIMGTLCWPKGRGGPSVPVPVQHLLTRQCGDDKQLDDDYDERRKGTGNGQTTAAISACIDSCLWSVNRKFRSPVAVSLERNEMAEQCV